MLLNHAGLVNKNREDAIRFYKDFIGLHLTREVTISKDLSEQLFSVSEDIPMLVFEKEGIKIEVFIFQDCEQPFPDIKHIGLSLKYFSEAIEKAKQMGVELIIGQTKDKTVYFIRDFSGNLIEIKQE